MEEDDEVIIFCDGAEAYSTYKNYKQNKADIYQVFQAFSNLTRTLTAYKRVDQKIRPIPGVIPEDLKVKRSIPGNPLDSLAELPTQPPEASLNLLGRAGGLP